jgi:hypothetical protein
MARTRTTKKLAQRIDLNYFKRPTPLKRAKFWLSLLLPLFALIWIAERTLSKDSRVYSSGRMSEPHAVLEKECATCHVQQAGAFSAKAADTACLACHDGPVHHPTQTPVPACASCHSEHRGGVNIASPSNQACAECHHDLKANRSTTQYASQINSFDDSHPEFAALRPIAGTAASDPGTIKLNHALHMKPIPRRPTGPSVQLECGNCHRVTAAEADLTYADPNYRASTVSYRDTDEVLLPRSEPRGTPHSVSGRQLMAPVKFANSCAACHLLTFDGRFDEGVPHDKPEVVHVFLVKQFTSYIASHPNELRELHDPDRDLTGKTLSPRVRILTAPQWVAERTAFAEELLWRKTCKQCHVLAYLPPTKIGVDAWRPSLSVSPGGEAANISQAASPSVANRPASHVLPQVAPANTTQQWMPHAIFDHGAHTGFTCESCHEKALTSTETSDILLPGIATCQTCHAPGPDHAESRCFECHAYHDWSKRKEVTPRFTLPALHIDAQTR